MTEERAVFVFICSPVRFARAIFAELGIFSEKHEALWFDVFKHARLPQAAS